LDLPGEVAQLVLNLEVVTTSLHNAYAPIAKDLKSVALTGPISEGKLDWYECSYFKNKTGRTRVFIPIHSAWGLNTQEKLVQYIETLAKEISINSKKIHQWLNSTQHEVNRLSNIDRTEKLRIFLHCLKQLEKPDLIPSEPAELENYLKAEIQKSSVSK
jgi:hypothetical protein